MNTAVRPPRIEGGFTEGLFKRTAKRLQDDDNALQAVVYFGLKGKLQNYQSVIDFLLCEGWHLPWKTRCNVFYRQIAEDPQHGLRAIDDKALLRMSTQYDVSLAFIILDEIIKMKSDYPSVSWRAVRKMIKTICHLERNLTKYTRY